MLGPPNNYPNHFVSTAMQQSIQMAISNCTRRTHSAFNSLICHAAALTWTASATGTFIMIAKLSRPSLPHFVIVWALLILLARPGLL